MDISSLEVNASKVVSFISALKKMKCTEKRIIVAIAGPPASGKSTLAEAVVKKLNRLAGVEDPAVLFPMDGFHLDNSILIQKGILHKKGAVESFDIDGLYLAIKSLSDNADNVFIPKFDRERDISIAGAIWIRPETRIVVIEGNYLLLRTEPWSALDGFYDASVFLSPSINTLRERLINRWLTHGLEMQSAIQRAETNDLVNAQLIIDNSKQADLVLDRNCEIIFEGLSPF